MSKFYIYIWGVFYFIIPLRFIVIGTRCHFREKSTIFRFQPFNLSQYVNNPAEQYKPDPALESIIDMVRAMKMPLLVTGEPGTGKTQLAHYIAAKFLGEEEKPLIFNTKTDSSARDLFYEYDAVRHFRDAGRDGSTNPMDYIEFVALGKAIHESDQKQQVVLIDEIDKAPRDFPNDLLYEIDQYAFQVKEAQVPEVKKKYGARVDEEGFIRLADEANKPIVIMTSNSEKNLPDAFMRRTLYHHIEFPQTEVRLKEIVEANIEPGKKYEEKMLKTAIDHFLKIRKMKGQRKLPATAELLSWIHYLDHKKIDIAAALEEKSERPLRELLFQSYGIIAKNQDDMDRLKRDLKL